MKIPLSDLMEAGVENTEPIDGLKGTHDVVETRTACAVGAAEFPIKAGMVNASEAQLYELLRTDIDEDPVGGLTMAASLYGCLWRLNDNTDLNRKAIVEWVRSIEDKYDLYLTVSEETPEPILPIPQPAD